jgi:hypothetical protein
MVDSPECNNYKKKLSIELLCSEAQKFCQSQSELKEPDLFGVTDGKAIGTFIEKSFKEYLESSCVFDEGNAAKGIDFPEINVDLKTTSINQPQSSCPFKSARQKIYGLGYSLLIFVYEKKEDDKNKSGNLNILHSIFVEEEKTADYQTTTGLQKVLENNGNKDDILAFFESILLPIDGIEADKLSDEVLSNPPVIGYLTISNALQWRLAYSRVIENAGKIDGLIKVK